MLKEDCKLLGRLAQSAFDYGVNKSPNN